MKKQYLEAKPTGRNIKPEFESDFLPEVEVDLKELCDSRIVIFNGEPCYVLESIGYYYLSSYARSYDYGDNLMRERKAPRELFGICASTLTRRCQPKPSGKPIAFVKE